MLDTSKLQKGDIINGPKYSFFKANNDANYVFLQNLKTSVKLRDQKNGQIISQKKDWVETHFSVVSTNKDWFEANNTNLIGRTFGDFKVINLNGEDSEHNILYNLKSTNDDSTMVASAWDLLNDKLDMRSEYSKKVDEDKQKVLDYIRNSTLNTVVDDEDEKEKEYEKNKYSNVLSFDDVNRDLFESPVYYHIAHCIPADCTFWGETATIVDQLWNMKEKIFHNNYLELVVGDVIWIENVFNLITTERKHLRPTIDDLRNCVENLATYCFENQISHLAMPRIGCGHNGLKWEDVRPMIVDTFNSVYKNKMENYNIEDDDVINNYRIDIIFCYR